MAGDEGGVSGMVETSKVGTETILYNTTGDVISRSKGG